MATQTTTKDTTQSTQQQTQGQQGQRRSSGSTDLARQSQGTQTPSLWRQGEGFFPLNPFSLLRRLQEDMDQLLGNFVSTGQPGMAASLWVPPIEVSERDGKFVISAEVPGVNEQDIEIEAVNDALVLHGVKQQERREGEGGVQRTERFYGEFYRVVPLPEGADPDRANARFENGVLRIEVPLAQSSRKKIPVQSSQSTQTTSQARTGEKSAA
jgi:HSP20 family protein